MAEQQRSRVFHLAQVKDGESEEEQQNNMFQLAQVKEGGDGEELTNVLVIITQNGVTPLNLNTTSGQQIVVVNQGDKATPTVVLNQNDKALTPSKAKVEPQFETDDNNPVVFKYGDSPVYQDVSVQTTEMKKYSRALANKKFKCLICGKELANSSILKRHIRIHTGVRPYECSLCHKRFTQSNDLTAHMRSHTGSRPFKCEVCGKGFTQRQNVKKHMLTHTGEKNYECEHCGKRFGRKHHMEEHSRIHTESNIRCEICQKGFTANGHLKRHMRKYHFEGDENLKDDIMKIVQHEQAEQDIENEIPVVNFVSTQDDSVETATIEIASIEPEPVPQILTIGQLGLDKPIDDVPEILYRCDLCEKQFKDLSFLERHLRLHLDGKLHNCNICHKVFNYKGLLKRHMVVHTKEKPWECNQCNKKFTQSNDLKIHMRLHTGIKPFKCEFCHMGFNQKQQLKNHRRKHTGERPYGCEKCDKRFSRRDHAKAHVKTHNNDHLRCQICAFTARNVLSLQKHLLKHDGVEKLLKPKDDSNIVRLRCRFCTKTYRDPFRLQKHEKQHENSRLYNCNICKQTYFRIDTFEKHCKIHEKDGLKAMAVRNETVKEDTEEYVGTMIKIEVDDTEEDYEDENNISNSNEMEKETVPFTTVEMTPDNTSTDSSKDFEKQSVLEVGVVDADGEIEKDQNTAEDDEVAATQKNTLYCCSHCGKMLPWNADLVKHMETHLPDKPGERPTDVTKTGIVQTTNDGRYLCSICGRHFTNLIALQSHIKNIHNMDISDYELNYKESEGVVMTAEEIRDIEKQIQENLRFTGCYSVLKNASKRHTKSVKGDDKEKPIYQCEICAKVVKRKENLERHRKLHKIIHKCDICNKVFKQRNHLETHRLIKHDTKGGEPITPTIHECDEPGCKKYFNKRFNLLRHQLIHRKKTEGESQDESMEDDDMLMVYECRKCYEAFMSLDELELHVNENHSDDTEHNGSHDDSAEVSKIIENEANISTGDAVPNEEEVVPVEIDISTLETVSPEARLEGNNQSEAEVNAPSLVEEVSQNFHIGGSAGQEVIELSSGNIPFVMNDSQGQEVIIQIPQDMNSGEENVYQCQIVKSSEDRSSEGVPVYITQHMVTTDPSDTTGTITMTTISSETNTSDSITIDSLHDTTDNDNNAAIAMVALSTDSSQYIDEDHSYI
ncbi:zinc finger protein 808-like isoform X2 [Mytilus trossulus]|uniref:zinc finger protein 808-like isoform X2 n=1 Tax=Mytilus trossulus TaxID=6551 RepID=UPI0030048B57